MKSDLIDELFKNLTPSEADTIFHGIDIEDDYIEKADKDQIKAKVIGKISKEKHVTGLYRQKAFKYKSIIAVASAAFILFNVVFYAGRLIEGVKGSLNKPSEIIKDKEAYTEDIYILREPIEKLIGSYKITARSIVSMDKKISVVLTSQRLGNSDGAAKDTELSKGNEVTLKDENGVELSKCEESHKLSRNKKSYDFYEEKKIFSNPNDVSEFQLFFMGMKVSEIKLTKAEEYKVNGENGAIGEYISSKMYVHPYELNGVSHFQVSGSSRYRSNLIGKVQVTPEDIEVKDSKGEVLPFKNSGFSIDGDYEIVKEGVKPYSITVKSINSSNLTNGIIYLPIPKEDNAAIENEKVSVQGDNGEFEINFPKIEKLKDGVCLYIAKDNEKIEVVKQSDISTTSGVQAEIKKIYISKEDRGAFGKDDRVKLEIKAINIKINGNWTTIMQ